MPVPETLVDVVCGYHLSIIRAGTLLGFFIKWLFDSSFMRAQVEVRANGLTRVGLSQYVIDRLPIPLPPDEELSIIAEFLGRETAKIDALVAEQRLLIELLKEKRQAVISHALTKGFDANAQFKPFHIAWAPEIPSHWVVKPLFTVAGFASGEAHEPYVHDDGSHILVNSRFVSTEGATRKPCTRNLSPARINDILMVMSDLPSGRALAKAFLVEDDASYAVNQRVCIVSPKAMHPRFMYYLLNRHPELLSHDDGANQTHLWNDLFRKLPVFIPPMVEQESIATFLDTQEEAIVALLREAERSIALLEQRRSALISAAVTGEIDVRNYAPDKAEAAQEAYALNSEIAFEDEICEHLGAHGWAYAKGDAEHYDRALALHPPDVLAWVQQTQPKTREALTSSHGARAGEALLTRLREQFDTRGTLDVLRTGIELVPVRGRITLAEWKPAFAMNPELTVRYQANYLRVVRQVRYSLANENCLDLVLFMNGVPVATAELKTDFTRSVEDAVDQYKYYRHPRPKGQQPEPLLSFPGGALVHFAVSNSEVWMTTRLAGPATRFLPFNRGTGYFLNGDGGAGNPSAGRTRADTRPRTCGSRCGRARAGLKS